MSYPPYEQPPQQPYYGSPPMQSPYGQQPYNPNYQQPYNPNYQQAPQPQGQWGAPVQPDYNVARAHSPLPPAGNYPPQGYGAPPQGYQQSYPPQQQPWAQPPPPPQGYPQLPQFGAPGYPMPPPAGYPQHGPPMGYPPQQPGYGGPPPMQQAGPHHDPGEDADALRKAMKGMGTNEHALISVLAHRDGNEINAIRHIYSKRHAPRSLVNDLKKETSGHFRSALVATALGPVDSEAYWIHEAIKGAGTRESVLTEAIFGRSNAELYRMKQVYRDSYGETLEHAVKSDLSLKTEKFFDIGMSGTRMDDWVQPDMQRVQRDVSALYSATVIKGTDEMTVCNIFAISNAVHLRAVAAEYKALHRKELRAVIVSEFSGHMKSALLYILDGAFNKVERDAKLLEESMKGLGTKDALLVSRLVRIHWDKRHFADVKMVYHRLYNKGLAERIRGETTGNYREMMIALTEAV